jgi:hypothetical protein
MEVLARGGMVDLFDKAPVLQLLVSANLVLCTFNDTRWYPCPLQDFHRFKTPYAGLFRSMHNITYAAGNVNSPQSFFVLRGGTSEIMRNLICSLRLGLPRSW